jgi:hypothetical protein
VKGSCLCGAVRFNVTGTPTAFDLCHCSRCRAASGSAFLAELEFTTAEFNWISGRSLVKTYEAPVRNWPPGYQRALHGLWCSGAHRRSGDHSRPGWDPRRRSRSSTAAPHLRRLRSPLVPNHRCSGPIWHKTQAGLAPRIGLWRGYKRFDCVRRTNQCPRWRLLIGKRADPT